MFSSGRSLASGAYAWKPSNDTLPSRDACKDRIAKLFRASFLRDRAQVARDVFAEWGMTQICLCT